MFKLFVHILCQIVSLGRSVGPETRHILCLAGWVCVTRGRCRLLSRPTHGLRRCFLVRRRRSEEGGGVDTFAARAKFFGPFPPPSPLGNCCANVTSSLFASSSIGVPIAMGATGIEAAFTTGDDCV